MATALGPELQRRLTELGIASPVDSEANSRWTAAPRLEKLNGKVGGFLGNRKANASLLLDNVRELLDKELELGGSFSLEKYVYSKPAAADIVDELVSRCDFVVTAIAD